MNGSSQVSPSKSDIGPIDPLWESQSSKPEKLTNQQKEGVILTCTLGIFIENYFKKHPKGFKPVVNNINKRFQQ